MAKKSNKTEHVLRLITKNEEALGENFFGIEQSFEEKGTVIALNAVQTLPEEITEVMDVRLKSIEEKELKEKEPRQEAKLKIAIEPEIELKTKRPDLQQKPEEKPEPKLEQKAEQKPEEKPEQKAEPKSSSQEKDNTGSAFIEENGHLVNIAEVLAKEKIALVMGKMKVCTCQTCFNDVLALTLNSLPTKYVTTDAGKQYFQLDMYKKQYETDVLAALTKSCVRVKASPRHL